MKILLNFTCDLFEIVSYPWCKNFHICEFLKNLHLPISLVSLHKVTPTEKHLSLIYPQGKKAFGVRLLAQSPLVHTLM